MVKVMRVIKEAVNVEKKRRQTSRKRLSDQTTKRTQRAKSLIVFIRHGRLMNKEEIGRRFEEIFGHGSSQEIENATTVEKILERIEDTSKREEQFELWEKMSQEVKRRQREDRSLNIFWRKNKCFPQQYGSDDETPEAEETPEFSMSINNKDASDEWREDRDIQGVLQEVRDKLQGRRCRWGEFTKAEFEEVFRCTAPWKACGVDSVNSFPIKKCPPIKKAVFVLVKRIVEWKVTDIWDEENNWLLEGRTVLIFKGETERTRQTTAPSHVCPQLRR